MEWSEQPTREAEQGPSQAGPRYTCSHARTGPRLLPPSLTHKRTSKGKGARDPRKRLTKESRSDLLRGLTDRSVSKVGLCPPPPLRPTSVASEAYRLGIQETSGE